METITRRISTVLAENIGEHWRTSLSVGGSFITGRYYFSHRSS